MTNPEAKEYCLKEFGSYLKTDEGYLAQKKGKDLHKMYFVLSNTYNNKIEVKFDPILNGIKSRVRGFYSDFLKEGYEKTYNGWNFTNNRVWDALTNESMWYNPVNQMIYKTVDFEIGKQRS